ncbi:MAG: SRPBCC domain-containing protein [Phycisphaerales bacterium]
MATTDTQVVQGSFHIEQEVTLRVPLERAWAGLLDVAGWWCCHFADRGARVVLEPFPGGRFFEESPEGPRALFGTVVYIKAPEIIRLHGPLGMGRLPVTSTYDWSLEPMGDPGATRLKLSHRAFGLLDPEWQQSHEEGWKSLWVRLAALVERGERYSN